MSKHTPGPWKAELIGKDHARVWGPKDDFIAELYRPHGKVYPSLANAKLIAAAPDLLEALEATIYVLELHHCADCKCSVCKNAKAAIAKAKGDLPCTFLISMAPWLIPVIDCTT